MESPKRRKCAEDPQKMEAPGQAKQLNTICYAYRCGSGGRTALTCALLPRPGSTQAAAIAGAGDCRRAPPTFGRQFPEDQRGDAIGQVVSGKGICVRHGRAGPIAIRREQAREGDVQRVEIVRIGMPIRRPAIAPR